jgi:hypothetical protein
MAIFIIFLGAFLVRAPVLHVFWTGRLVGRPYSGWGDHDPTGLLKPKPGADLFSKNSCFLSLFFIIIIFDHYVTILKTL